MVHSGSVYQLAHKIPANWAGFCKPAQVSSSKQLSWETLIRFQINSRIPGNGAGAAWFSEFLSYSDTFPGLSTTDLHVWFAGPLHQH